VDQNGFSSIDGVSDRFLFPKTTAYWQQSETSSFGQSVFLGNFEGAPQKLRFDQFDHGVWFYFPTGIKLRLACLSAPFLSWKEASVGKDVPTPESKWILCSFRNNQPAVLFTFEGKPQALRITGRAGNFSLESTNKFAGWVRIALPAGLKRVSTNTAESLGIIVANVAKFEHVWNTPRPKLVKTETTFTPVSITKSYTFQNAGFAVPHWVGFSELGGYSLKRDSAIDRLPGLTPEGPMQVSKEKTLIVRMPIKLFPLGLPVPTQKRDVNLSLDQFNDFRAVSKIAFQLLAGEHSRDFLAQAKVIRNRYLAETKYEREPLTRQLLPYDAVGNNIDLAAAHALLVEALGRAQNEPNTDYGLLTTIFWRLDWQTGQLAVKDDQLRRRASALASLAAILTENDVFREKAAIIQAGLAAERGVNIWLRRQKYLTTDPKLLEPLPGLRKAIFSIQNPGFRIDPMASYLLSPLRSLTEDVFLTETGTIPTLEWTADAKLEGEMKVRLPQGISLAKSLNLAEFTQQREGEFTRVRYKALQPGTCKAIFVPAFKPLFPLVQPIDLSYSEINL